MVVKYIQELSDELRIDVENFDYEQDSRNTTITWEIKHELRAAINEILEAASKAVEKKIGI